MNILFALYGGLDTNSAEPLNVYAREFHELGYECAVAMPEGYSVPDSSRGAPSLRTVSYGEALAGPAAIFTNGRPADVLQAWTPRECVRLFVTAYLAKLPTPWVIYLEDNEGWIAKAALSLVGLPPAIVFQHSEEVISTWTPQGLPHILRYESFTGLADAAVIIHDKLAVEVPPWVPRTTVMPCVDLEFFLPRPADPWLRKRYAIAENERVVVYPGGLNDFTRPGLIALCLAVGLINRQGTPCKLLRSGPVALDFVEQLPFDAAAAIIDLGRLPRADLPGLLALADVLVQPGKPDAFEDLRLPGKVPEFLASGRPVLLPDTNIAHLLRDGVNAIFHRTGSPEEMAEKCLALFTDPGGAHEIGKAGRRFAEAHFNPETQTRRLESVYRAAQHAFNPQAARDLWSADAEHLSVTDLLARRLRLLASSRSNRSPGEAAMMEAHARSIEFGQERSRGLEAGMAVRDRQIASLKDEVATRDGHIANLQRDIAEVDGKLLAAGQRVAERERHIVALESSLIWRMTRPFRIAGERVRRLGTRFRSPPNRRS